MKLSIRHRQVHRVRALDSFIEERLGALTDIARIGAARVLLERSAEGRPGFRAEVRLTVRGPGLSAEAFDHTIAHAFRRAVTELEGKLRERARRRGPASRRSARRTPARVP